MKVICIKQDSINLNPSDKSGGLLREGSVYTVTEEFNETDGIYYVLEEINPIYIFWSMLFIPLSNIDEMELLEQRQDQLQSL